jgi:uncharacterized membrane protein
MNNLDPQAIAAILLAFRIIATVLLTAVVIKQIYNMRHKSTDYPAVRITVFILTLTLLIGQALPITLDSVVAFTSNKIGRAANPSLLGTYYAVNNALKDVIIGTLLAFLHFRQTPPKRDPQTGV